MNQDRELHNDVWILFYIIICLTVFLIYCSYVNYHSTKLAIWEIHTMRTYRWRYYLFQFYYPFFTLHKSCFLAFLFYSRCTIFFLLLVVFIHEDCYMTSLPCWIYKGLNPCGCWFDPYKIVVESSFTYSCTLNFTRLSWLCSICDLLLGYFG